MDLLVHFKGGEDQKKEFQQWIDGWSVCLDEINYSKTGYRSGGLIDMHLITDENIEEKRWDAVKINSMTDPATEIPLPLKAQL